VGDLVGPASEPWRMPKLNTAESRSAAESKLGLFEVRGRRRDVVAGVQMMTPASSRAKVSP